MSYWQQTKVQNSSGTVIDPATSTIQTDGTQKTQIVDGSGNVIDSTNNHLKTASMLINEAGVAYGVKHIDNKPRVSSTPYLFDIAEGNVANRAAFRIFAINYDIDITSEDVWPAGGVYQPPTSASALEVVSSSVEDDPDKGGSVPGTGIHTVTLYYLKNDFSEATEDINLNGTSAVTTANSDIYRVQFLRAKAVGTSGAAVGTITLRTVGGGVVYSTIEAGYTNSRNSFYTIPKDKALYITSMFGGCTSTSANGSTITLRATYDPEAGAIRSFFLPHAEVMVGSSSGGVYQPFECPLYFPAGTDIKCSANSLANNASVSISLRGWIETA